MTLNIVKVKLGKFFSKNSFIHLNVNCSMEILFNLFQTFRLQVLIVNIEVGRKIWTK